MKRLNEGIKVVLVLCLLTVGGCGSSGTTSQQSTTENANTINYWTLEDFLRRANGVQVDGVGDNISVTIRGNNSIANPNGQPLFVVDGQKAGRNFTRVSRMFSRGEIVSVKVLPAGSASVYGMQGNYGVIIIESNRSL